MFLGAEDVEDVDSLERFLLLEEAYVVLVPGKHKRRPAISTTWRGSARSFR